MFCSLGLVGRTHRGLIAVPRLVDDEPDEWLVAVRAQSRSAIGSGEQMAGSSMVSVSRIERKILLVRGQKVLLDSDLAELYEVETKELNKAVNRNLDRFPADFLFRLTQVEFDELRFQSGTSKGRGGRRYLPFAFTEQGVAMLSSVLRSDRAVRVNVEIMRAFVRLREMLVSHADLAAKLDALEQKYDGRFAVVFQALRGLMDDKGRKKPPIGYLTEAKPARSRRR